MSDLKADICRAFGVTEEEIDALDRVMMGPETRAAFERYRERLPARMQALADDLSVLLPEGVTFEFTTKEHP